MEVVRIILSVILGLDCLALIVLVLMQQGKTAGLSGAIAGGAETFFGKKKASEGKMELYTKILGAGFMVLAVVLLILQRFA